ncbi:MAG: TetR/AcrR family transcriptional regulator [Myxococcota bacterium]
MARPSLSREHVDAFRSQACDAAIELFGNQPEVSLRQLAQAMGCSHATPYRYFRSKQDLFMAVRAECFRRFRAYLEGLVEGTDPRADVFAVCRGYAEYAQRRPAEFLLMFQLGQPSPEDHPEAEQAGLDAWATVEGTVRRAIRAGLLDGQPRTVAHLLWAAVHGVVSLSLAKRLVVGYDAAELIDPIVSALWRAHGGHP